MGWGRSEKKVKTKVINRCKYYNVHTHITCRTREAPLA